MYDCEECGAGRMPGEPCPMKNCPSNQRDEE